ncbi:MAG: DUF624 domain-containing protein [Clostridiales bacterium]|nr:DUF624 domain-containing protein [Clostridiales bacterium]
MSGLFNSFYYGKAGKADFTPDQLPKNRVQLFFSMLRVRFSGLIGLNLLHILFSLPAIIWTVINAMVLIYGSGVNLETGEITEAMSAGEMSGNIMFYLLIMIPCLMIASIGRMGLAMPMRNWARDDHSFVWSDFKDTVKANWKTALGIGFISGLSLLLTYVGFTYYSAMTARSILWIVPQVLIVVFCCIWWMSTMLLYPMAVTYDMKFRVLIQNSIIMTLARLPIAFLCWAPITFIPLIVAYYVPSNIVLLILAVYYVLFGFSLYQFLAASYANACFDRFLNPRIEGADVNKGLRDPSYNEEDDTVTDEDIKNL